MADKKILIDFNFGGVSRPTNLPDGTASDHAINLGQLNATVSGIVFDGIAISSINELSDVDTATEAPIEDQVLKWDGGNWVPGSPEVLIEVKNPDTVNALSKGTPVYVSGVTAGASGKPEVSPARANSLSTMPAIGLVAKDIAADSDGFVVAGGIVEGVDNSAPNWTVGTPLYVSTSTAGGLTISRPGGTNDLVQKVALITRSGSNGRVVVMGAGRTNDIPNDLVTLTGVPLGDSDLGTFNAAIFGVRIPDNSDNKEAFQYLSTQLGNAYQEARDATNGVTTLDTDTTSSFDNVVDLIGREDADGNLVGTIADTDLGTSPGSPIPDGSTIYNALKLITQDLGVPNDNSVTTAKIVAESITSDKIAEDNQYHSRYDTEASAQRTAGSVSPLTCEIYYTARPDGDGYAESEETATPPSGARIVRRLYYSDKFNADPTVSADWTAYTSQPADNTTFAAAKASLLAGLSDTDATANTRGTLPVSLKMEYEAVLDRLLNDYPGAEAAYSVRLIDKNYSGPCMRVRNVSTNARSDIGFTTDGDLDTDAIETLCGSANGAVEIWYDQSGGGHHQVQNTTTLQPFIYLGGSGVLIQNGRPVIIFTDGGQLVNESYTGSPSVTVSTMTSFTTTSPAPGYTFCVVGPGGDYSTYSNFMIGTSTGGGTRFGFCTTTGTGAPDADISCTHFVNQLEQISPTQASLYAAIDPQAVVTTEWTSTDLSPRRWYINYNYPFAGSLQVQEYVIYYADKGTDQSAIEQAIDGHYQPTTALIIDAYRSAAAAYSVRQLSQWYTGSCMKVRRDSDGTTQDIGFDSNGDLDTAAIKTFCDAGGAGTLGYVHTWYDQSGSGRHLSQTGDDAKQPQIYDGTAVITANGRPALDSRSGAARLYSASTTISPTMTIMLVKSGSGGLFGQPVWGSTGSFSMVRDYSASPGSYGINLAAVTGTPPTDAIYTMKYGSAAATRSNGSQVATTTGNSTLNVGLISLGGRYENTEGAWSGKAHELIIWNVDHYSTAAAELESNANTYFGIF